MALDVEVTNLEWLAQQPIQAIFDRLCDMLVGCSSLHFRAKSAKVLIPAARVMEALHMATVVVYAAETDKAELIVEVAANPVLRPLSVSEWLDAME